MSNKVSYSFTMGGNAIDAAIPSLEKSIGTVVQNVQKLAVSILRDFKTHGDKPTTTRRVNALIKALGKGMRANSLTAWFEQNAPLVFNKETKQLVCGFTGMSPCKDHTKINIEQAMAALWQDAVAEPEYTPLADWSKALEAIIKRAKTDLEKMGDKSKVNKGQLAALELMLAAPKVADPLA